LKENPVLIGITGASGAIYARTLLETLAASCDGEVLVVVSGPGRRVLREELGVTLAQPGEERFGWLRLTAAQTEKIRLLPVEDMGAGPASGTFPLCAMAVVPCSMRTLAAISAGIADNLLTRAADVCIKEGRRLVLAPRETPLSAIHLENMLRLARLGVRIVPPMPAFYHGPQTVEDLARFVVQKIIEQMGLEFPNPARWSGAPNISL
jgi:4-hydroxy-3-polyprenylbenzoate decarboxylase